MLKCVGGLVLKLLHCDIAYMFLRLCYLSPPGRRALELRLPKNLLGERDPPPKKEKKKKKKVQQPEEP